MSKWCSNRRMAHAAVPILVLSFVSCAKVTSQTD